MDYSETWIREFFSVIPQMKNEPTFVKDRICQNGVFFEDPLNVLNKGDGWGSWDYLDCIYPEQLKHDLSNYDYITREDGLRMLSVFHESDGSIERQIEFRQAVLDRVYCNTVFYHVFEYPKRVEIGEEFFINATYSWITPNEDVEINTSEEFDVKQFNQNCGTPSFQLLVPRQMNFVNTESLDEYNFSTNSHRFIAEKSVPFDNTAPQTLSFRFVVTESIFELYEIIEMGIHLEDDNIFTISTDDNFVYFGNNTIYHDFESRSHPIGYGQPLNIWDRPHEKGPIMLLYAEYLHENHPNADILFIENDLKINNKGSKEKYIQVFLENYPEFNR